MRRSLRLMTGALLVTALLTAACNRHDTAAPTDAPGDGRNPDMAKDITTLPSFAESPESPNLNGPGLVIRLEPPQRGRVYAADEPIVLYGKYGADAKLNDQAEGAPLTRIVVRVGTAEQEDAPGKAVKDAHTMPPRPASSGGDGDYVIYGYFNLDLRKFSKAIKDPGPYWVTAELFEHKTRKVLFEVK